MAGVSQVKTRAIAVVAVHRCMIRPQPPTWQRYLVWYLWSTAVSTVAFALSSLVFLGTVPGPWTALASVLYAVPEWIFLAVVTLPVGLIPFLGWFLIVRAWPNAEASPVIFCASEALLVAIIVLGRFGFLAYPVHLAN